MKPIVRKCRKVEVYFPHDIIYGILTYLPVLSLLRFKSACKLWYATIENRRFIYEHMKRQGRTPYLYEQEVGSEFMCKDEVLGILLELNKSSKRYRCRNPFTREVVDLPSPRRSSKAIFFVRIFTKRWEVSFKLISLSELEGDDENLVCEVLRVGVDQSWRLLELPSFHQLPIFWICQGSKAIHFIQFDNDDESNNEVKVASLDYENECFYVCSTPKHSFPCLKEVSSAYWDGYLGFAKIEGGNLKGLILKDHRRQQWNEIVIPLKFWKDNPYVKKNKSVFKCVVYNQDIYFLWNEKVIAYSIELGKITHTTSEDELSNLHSTTTRATLYSVMQPPDKIKLITLPKIVN